MNHRTKQFLVAAATLGCAFTASAAERNPALDLLVKKGIIQPRDEKYVERTKTGKVAEDATAPAKKAGKKANK